MQLYHAGRFPVIAMIGQIDDLANSGSTRQIAACVKPQRLEFDEIGVVPDMALHALPGCFRGLWHAGG